MKVLVVGLLSLLAGSPAWSVDLDCVRTSASGAKTRVSVPRASIIKSGRFSVSKDSFLTKKPGVDRDNDWNRHDVFQGLKKSALQISIMIRDFARADMDPDKPIFDQNPIQVRASRFLPFVRIEDGVPVIPAVQTIVTCPGVEIAANEKIFFKFKVFDRGDMPWIDFTTFETVEANTISQPVILSSVYWAAVRGGSRLTHGTYSKYFAQTKKLDLVWTTTDGQEVTDFQLLEPAAEAYPGVSRAYGCGGGRLCEGTRPTINNAKRMKFDNTWNSPLLQILK